MSIYTWISSQEVKNHVLWGIEFISFIPESYLITNLEAQKITTWIQHSLPYLSYLKAEVGSIIEWQPWLWRSNNAMFSGSTQTSKNIGIVILTGIEVVNTMG